MGDIGAMKELLGRVERVTGADRDIDRPIFDVLLGGVYDSRTVGEFFYRPRIEAFPVEFTKSLDACAALIEKLLPGATFSLIDFWTEDGLPSAFINIGGGRTDLGKAVQGTAHSRCLALLAALIRALILIEERKALAEGEVRP